MHHVCNWQIRSVIYSFGGGLEYFVADNMAVGVEAKYLSQDPNVRISGVSTEFDLDSVILTIGLRVFYP